MIYTIAFYKDIKDVTNFAKGWGKHIKIVSVGQIIPYVKMEGFAVKSLLTQFNLCDVYYREEK